MENEPHFIAPVKIGASLILEPAPNGGWVVYEAGPDNRERPRIVGAFSRGADMLAALSGIGDFHG